MKNLSFLFITCIFLLVSCKSDSASSTKAAYPAVWKEKGVPAYSNGLITSEKLNDASKKIDYIVTLETDDSYDDIYKWHKSSFSEKGWKIVRDNRKNIGEESESIVLVHTKGKLKHSAIVLKAFSGKNQIKTTLSFFNMN